MGNRTEAECSSKRGKLVARLITLCLSGTKVQAQFLILPDKKKANLKMLGQILALFYVI